MFGLAPEGPFVVSVAQNNSATVTNVVRNALPIVLEHCRPYWAVLERNWLSHRPIGDNDLTQSTDAISVALWRFLLLIQLKLGSKNCIGRSSQYTESCLRRSFPSEVWKKTHRSAILVFRSKACGLYSFEVTRHTSQAGGRRRGIHYTSPYIQFKSRSSKYLYSNVKPSFFRWPHFS